MSTAYATSAVPTVPPGENPLSMNLTGGTRVQPMSGGADVGPSNPLPVTATGGTGSASFATAQVTVAATATLIAAARAGRQAITVTQIGSTLIYIGLVGVTTGTGTPLTGIPGASLTIPTSAAVYGISSTGTDVVGVLETYT